MEGPRLEGKIAVVTGGGTGLGRAVVLALAERGADVAFSFHASARGAEEAAAAVRTLGRRVWASRAGRSALSWSGRRRRWAGSTCS
jgi:NAD(P)-dependent dehydrogenase (short-subunit alcohol dehydrogenase family)